MTKFFTIPFIMLIWFCMNVRAEDSDQFEKMGWSKIESLETPDPVAKDTGSQTPIELLKIETPAITLQNHLVAGELRYSNVQGSGFVELWTEYDDGGRYFSRTMGDYGPMAKLAGNSEWRRFMLPFRGSGDKIPTRLELNIVLPGGGEVELRNVGLYQADRSPSQGWWPERTGAWVGAVAGSSIGILGGLLGILAGMGKARRFVISLMMAMLVIGGLLLIAGVIALIAKQPYHVWYPLTLSGFITSLVLGLSFRTVKKGYITRELRQIAAAG